MFDINSLLYKTITQKDGHYYVDGMELYIKSDDGDCCGFADGDIEFFKEGLITRVDVDEDESSARIVVYHENTVLADIEMYAGSGSGACTTLYLDTTPLVDVSW
jgi:hypothetical protein